MKSYDFFRVPTLTHAYFYNYHDLGHFSLVLAELWIPNFNLWRISDHFKNLTLLQSLNQKIKIPFQLGSFFLVPFSQ